MNKPFSLLGRDISPGKSTTVNLDIARLHNHAKIEIPVIVDHGKKPGPVLLLMAGIHGNELNGIEIIRSLIAGHYTRPDYGTVVSIPVINVFGFLNQSREFPDGKDLNRSFPGSKHGSLASIFAYYLMKEIIPFVDFCVDFHTGGANRFNSSQIRIGKNNPDLLELSKIFNPRFIVYAPDRDKSFRQTATKIGKKILLFEGGKSLDFHQRITERGKYGILQLMDYLKMRDFSTELANYHYDPSIVIRKSHWLRARHGGLFRFTVKDGAHVTKGQIIGSISDPYGKFEHIVKIPSEGYIIGLNHSPIVYQGDALIHLGTE